MARQLNEPPSPTHTRRLGDALVVAQILMCDPRTVYRRADDGSMPWGVKIGALRRWDLDELNDWIASGCKPVGAPTEASHT